jgi:hypothetical protein
MKTSIIVAFLLLGSVVTGFAQKNSLKEYVSNIPDGRNILIQPHFVNKEHVEGKIAIDFVIDKKGNVISAHINPKHTTIRNRAARAECEQAVKEAKFSELKKGPETQKASLSFAF